MGRPAQRSRRELRGLLVRAAGACLLALGLASAFVAPGAPRPARLRQAWPRRAAAAEAPEAPEAPAGPGLGRQRDAWPGAGRSGEREVWITIMIITTITTHYYYHY